MVEEEGPEKRSPERRNTSREVKEVEVFEVPPIALPELGALTAERRSASVDATEETDLEVPEGIEGPVPTYVVPGDTSQL